MTIPSSPLTPNQEWERSMRDKHQIIEEPDEKKFSRPVLKESSGKRFPVRLYLIANRKLSKAISDLGFYEFRRQLTYKAPVFGCSLDVVARWFPSSQMCRECGEKHSGLKLSDRTFVCPSCRHTEDRDLQASKNLANAPDELCRRVGSPRTYTPVDKSQPSALDETGILSTDV